MVPNVWCFCVTRCAQNYSYTHLSAGDLLREERSRTGSEFGQLIDSYIKEGKIVPVEITINLLKKVVTGYTCLSSFTSLSSPVRAIVEGSWNISSWNWEILLRVNLITNVCSLTYLWRRVQRAVHKGLNAQACLIIGINHNSDDTITKRPSLFIAKF